MTTLIYQQDVIAGDSLQFITANASTFPIRGPKVFLNKAKTIGFGICGFYYSKKYAESFEKWIEDQLVAHIEQRPVKHFSKKPSGFCVIAMTKNGTYFINHNSEKVSVNLIDNEDYCVNGTGGGHAVIHLLLGMSAVDAVKQALKIDPMSGCDIYAVKRSSLKPHKVI